MPNGITYARKKTHRARSRACACATISFAAAMRVGYYKNTRAHRSQGCIYTRARAGPRACADFWHKGQFASLELFQIAKGSPTS